MLFLYETVSMLFRLIFAGIMLALSTVCKVVSLIA